MTAWHSWAMEIPGVGPLTLDPDLGAYRSEPVTANVLGGTVGHFLIDEDTDPADDLAPVHEAARAFLALDPGALEAASSHVYAYYVDMVTIGRASGMAAPPEVTGPHAVWDHVTFGTEFWLERLDGRAYVSVECECSWEPEHGLQLVFRDGRGVTRVGPFDGSLTNGGEVVYRHVSDRFPGNG